MAYSELIKDFERIRDYVRQFYIYGFKSRDDFRAKSARSYDDERRRIESWLGDYMSFRQTADGKNVFLAIDSRIFHHNPLYKALKAKSFTDGDITLHFLLFDILYQPETALSLGQITAQIDQRLAGFANPKTFDESTVRKKLKEYVQLGLVETGRQGRTVLYRRQADQPLTCCDALNFFSEAAPCGVIGSFLLDKVENHNDYFAFKHHYITSALDSEILAILFDAIQNRQNVRLTTVSFRPKGVRPVNAVPLRIFISVQNGRQYLFAYVGATRRISSFRLDNISTVVALDPCPDYERLRAKLDQLQSGMWGVSTTNQNRPLQHVEFTVRYSPDEEHIHRRLLREKRCGRVERLSPVTSRFSADVYDANELVPWIRTFICRITRIQFSEPLQQKRFYDDLNAMYKMYGLKKEGGAE